MKKNYMVDVAFEVEGDWDTFDDIPLEVLMAGLRARVKKLERLAERDSFGLCDSYEVKDKEAKK